MYTQTYLGKDTQLSINKLNTFKFYTISKRRKFTVIMHAYKTCNNIKRKMEAIGVHVHTGTTEC